MLSSLPVGVLYNTLIDTKSEVQVNLYQAQSDVPSA